jgi:hypothetical protein
MPIGTIRVIASITGGIPRPAINVWHSSVADTTSANAQGFVDALRDFYTTAASLFPSTVTITVGTAVTAISTTPPLILAPTPRVIAGTGTGGASAAQLAEVVSWRTPFAGKSFRGRTYLGPIAVSAITGGILNTPVTTAVQNAANALVAASNSSVDWDMVVWSTKLNTQSTISSGVANNKLETQRRRNR